MQPFACQIPDNVTTTSRPERCVRNSTDACPAHSHTSTPYPKLTRCVRPRVRSTQIAQGFCFPM
ncbi:MAG: hypothetical protein QOE17_1740 [Gaiellales bacterium]|nr:hypothetical protein [Gaiellales bacterium]